LKRVLKLYHSFYITEIWTLKQRDIRSLKTAGMKHETYSRIQFIKPRQNEDTVDELK